MWGNVILRVLRVDFTHGFTVCVRYSVVSKSAAYTIVDL